MNTENKHTVNPQTTEAIDNVKMSLNTALTLFSCTNKTDGQVILFATEKAKHDFYQVSSLLINNYDANAFESANELRTDINAIIKSASERWGEPFMGAVMNNCFRMLRALSHIKKHGHYYETPNPSVLDRIDELMGKAEDKGFKPQDWAFICSMPKRHTTLWVKSESPFLPMGMSLTGRFYSYITPFYWPGFCICGDTLSLSMSPRLGGDGFILDGDADVMINEILETLRKTIRANAKADRETRWDPRKLDWPFTSYRAFPFGWSLSGKVDINHNGQAMPYNVNWEHKALKVSSIDGEFDKDYDTDPTPFYAVESKLIGDTLPRLRSMLRVLARDLKNDDSKAVCAAHGFTWGLYDGYDNYITNGKAE